jgi:acyl-CoA synthetase (AMP-forming)/AMP-acid ligase II
VARSAYVAVEHEGSVHGVAFVTSKPGAQLDTAALEARARRELASFKVPRVWSVLPELPLLAGANGDKVDRRTLGDLARQALSGDRAGVHR